MIYVILPAFNEEAGLPKVLTKIKEISSTSKENFRVVVVDDGSKDRTSEIARSFQSQLDLHVIQFSENKGVAEVFRNGFHFASKNSLEPDQDIAIVLDSDNTQDPDVMLAMVG